MLKVNEIFGPTIQGEGKSIGKEVSFIRLSLCNLQCVWCDTPYTWNWEGTPFLHQSDQKYKMSDELHVMEVPQILAKVMEIGVRAVVISGGEPLLQQKELIPLCIKLKGLGFWIEVETNGTKVLLPEFIEHIDQINCSPKLLNSKNKLKLMERPQALHTLSQCEKTNFKFVVSSDEDIPEILQLVQTYQMKEVYLMPLGMTKDELNLTREKTEKIAELHGFHFTDRAHITVFGGGRGI